MECVVRAARQLGLWLRARVGKVAPSRVTRAESPAFSSIAFNPTTVRPRSAR